MERKWYRSNITKAVLIIAAHIFVIISTANFMWTCAYPALQDEMFAEKPAKKYEDSKYFENQVQNYAHQAVIGIGAKELFETDGEYDPDKTVDIKTFFETGNFKGSESKGLSYRLGDLIDWYGSLYGTSIEEDYAGENRIFVCKMADNTYHYYRAPEFYDLLNTQTLRFVIVNENSEYTYSSVIAELQEGMDFPEGMFRGIQDENGKMLYSECWIYDGEIMEEEYAPIEGEDILSIVNTDPNWNGKLNDAYAMLRSVIDTVYDEYSNYLRTDEDIEEGNSNFSYIYADTKNKVVFTNKKEYRDYKKLEASLEKIQNTGKYVIVRPKLADFETNMDNVDPDSWRDLGQKTSANSEEFLLAAAVDTDYPIQDDFYSEDQMYAQYGADARGILITFIVSTLLFILCTLWLCIVAGRSSQDNEVHLNSFDLWKSEITAAVVIVLWAIPVAFLYESVVYGIVRRGTVTDSIPYIILACAVAAYTCAWFLTGLLSLIRRIKAGTLWKNSILRILCRWLVKAFIVVVDFVRMIVSNLSCIWKTILAFGVFWLLEIIFVVSIFSYGADGLSLLILLLVNIAAFIYMLYRAVGLNAIQKGIRKISDGEVEYQIPLKNLHGDHKAMAEKINSIGEGLDAAVEKSMKSERLKTDLITNVSHDIKTPLTSIINYVELLKQENFDDPKIKRYIEVLEQKSQRLKNLTEDVVEASKVSSGNISLEYVKLNLTEMLQQVSGEFEEKFKEKNLKEVLELPGGETIIRADGRRTWRVFENIYNNAAKYAMEGTRVYAELVKRDGQAIFTLKNISSQELNISADELTERFIRGDISRSTEGSGLGLSIAKSLTTMQGGSFDLYLDGDLFKVTIQFPTCA